jgi:hypothetical protein
VVRYKPHSDIQLITFLNNIAAARVRVCGLGALISTPTRKVPITRFVIQGLLPKVQLGPSYAIRSPELIIKNLSECAALNQVVARLSPVLRPRYLAKNPLEIINPGIIISFEDDSGGKILEDLLVLQKMYISSYYCSIHPHFPKRSVRMCHKCYGLVPNTSLPPYSSNCLSDMTITRTIAPGFPNADFVALRPTKRSTTVALANVLPALWMTPLPNSAPPDTALLANPPNTWPLTRIAHHTKRSKTRSTHSTRAQAPNPRLTKTDSKLSNPAIPLRRMLRPRSFLASLEHPPPNPRVRAKLPRTSIPTLCSRPLRVWVTPSRLWRQIMRWKAMISLKRKISSTPAELLLPEAGPPTSTCPNCHPLREKNPPTYLYYTLLYVK